MSSWILTYSGKLFWTLEPRVEDLDIHDIAHALSYQCRFNGHCKYFFSVAQHAVMVSNIVPAEYALWGLMHDASEAYIPDMPGPTKRHLPEFQRVEEAILKVIAEWQGLPYPIPKEVKVGDNVSLATEYRDLMPKSPIPWSFLDDYPPLPERLYPLAPRVAELQFLRRYDELTGAETAWD